MSITVLRVLSESELAEVTIIPVALKEVQVVPPSIETYTVRGET
jgi:hypothetical protein